MIEPDENKAVTPRDVRRELAAAFTELANSFVEDGLDPEDIVSAFMAAAVNFSYQRYGANPTHTWLDEIMREAGAITRDGKPLQ
jgi:hypothetical protein